MLLIVICILCVALSSTSGEECKNPCRCGEIDLTQVGLPDRPRFDQFLYEEKLYSYNPCIAFDSSAQVIVAKNMQACAGAAACIKTPGSSSGVLPEEHTIGLQKDAFFELKSEKENKITYKIPGSDGKNLTVDLTCEKNMTDHLLQMTNISDGNIFMTLTSKCACPGLCSSGPDPDSPSGLSTGSKLLIAFFTIAISYFIVGIVWNYCNGAQGLEVVPNLDFWNELPKLIVEGIIFACPFCGRKRSYGEV